MPASNPGIPDLHFEGVGLHSGHYTRVTLKRAAPGSGLILRRTDLNEILEFPAKTQYVVSGKRHTVLAQRNSDSSDPAPSVATPEHLLAVALGLGIWDLLIEMDGPEVPILDGSAAPFAAALASWPEPVHAPSAFQLGKQLEIRRDEGVILAEPAPYFRVECDIDFPHPHIGQQRFCWNGERASFLRDIAPARTFGFVEEVDLLRSQGLIAGGSLENALVFGKNGPLNPLRFPDEPVRHKVLDVLGDLALLGRPLQAHLKLIRPGHALIHELLRLLDETESLS